MALPFETWLQEQLDKHEWKQADLVRASDHALKIATVSKWIRGASKPEDQDLITILARTLRISVEDVQRAIREEDAPGGRPVARSAEDILAELEANQPVAVPIIQDLVAHMGSGGGFVADYWYLPPRYRKSKKKNILGVIAVGECMSPLIEPGDYVVFDTDAPWKKGDIVVAVVDGTMQVKRLIETEKRIVLRGDADGSTLTLGPNDQIFGRVIMFTRPLVPLEM